MTLPDIVGKLAAKTCQLEGSYENRYLTALQFENAKLIAERDSKTKSLEYLQEHLETRQEMQTDETVDIHELKNKNSVLEAYMKLVTGEEFEINKLLEDVKKHNRLYIAKLNDYRPRVEVIEKDLVELRTLRDECAKLKEEAMKRMAPSY